MYFLPTVSRHFYEELPGRVPPVGFPGSQFMHPKVERDSW